MSKTILVTGDWVADWHLARPANSPEGYFDGNNDTQLCPRAGGAWYLAHLIEQVACHDLCQRQEVVVRSARKVEEAFAASASKAEMGTDIADAYSLWSQQKKDLGSKKADTWRVERLLGCRRAAKVWMPKDDSKIQADIVVIDDLGLGFADLSLQANDQGALPPKAYPAHEHAFSSLKDGGQIVLKHGVRSQTSPLWQKLAAENRLDQLTVIVTAQQLRYRQAALSVATSWDQALEEIEREFTSGNSFRELRKAGRVIVHFGLEGAAVFEKGNLQTFVFLPDELEGSCASRHPGMIFGGGTILTATVVRHLVEMETDGYPLFFALTQALAAQRKAYEIGAGSAPDKPQIDLAFGARNSPANNSENLAARIIGPPLEVSASETDKQKEIRLQTNKDRKMPLDSFRAAWNPKTLPVWPVSSVCGNGKESTCSRTRLLRNVTGPGLDAFIAKATEIITLGPEYALASVPKARYAGYVTVDRDEIERINEVRRLIDNYRQDPNDKRPLSLAVFGPPGCGKSFAVKQLGIALFGAEPQPLEFNLSQFSGREDLHRAFHQVRDASIRQAIPLVFWDEFDAGDMKWLADFLAPMQDAEFFDGSHKHPFGKAIFIFAGGTRERMECFKEWKLISDTSEKTTEDPWHVSFKAVKGPDFVSRLRGYVNIKGPNPAGQDCATDPTYVLRRALNIRSEIERNFPLLIDPATKRARIGPAVIQALLRTGKYEHGARSIGAVFSMSSLASARSFSRSMLPGREILTEHVAKDFFSFLDDPAWSEDLFEALARAGFEGWKEQKAKEGYRFALTRNDDLTKGMLTHPLIKEWSQLTIAQKISNTDPVHRRLLAIERLGWRIVPGKQETSSLAPEKKSELIKALIEPEHHIWLADHLVAGWTKAMGAESNDKLLQHTDIRNFDELPQKQQDLNFSIVTKTIEGIETAGYTLEKLATEI